MPVAVGDGLFRLQVLDEGNPLLQGLDDLLVVQTVRGRVLHRAPVDDGDAAPFPAEAREVRGLGRRPGALALAAHLGAVMEEPVEHLALLAVEDGPEPRFPPRPRERLVSGEGLLRQQRVVGEELGRGVDRRQASADHDRRQLDLQIGERLLLARPGQLKRHQEVGGLAHAADQVVLDVDDRRSAGAGGDRDVIDPIANACSAVTVPPPTRPTIEKRGPGEVTCGKSEVLVPANGDPVLGHARSREGRSSSGRSISLQSRRAGFPSAPVHSSGAARSSAVDPATPKPRSSGRGCTAGPGHDQDLFPV
jgi:hypothetical protein